MTELVRLRRAPDRSGRALEDGMNFAAVLAESIGHNPDFELEIPEWDGPPATQEEAVWRALHEVPDPEFPISLPDLGLIYDVEVDHDTARVALTFTASACPCTDFIQWDVRERLLQLEGIGRVDIEVTWDPPWTTSRITDRGRRALKRAGVAV